MSAELTPYGRYAPSRGAARLIAWTRAMPDNWLGRRAALWLRRRALGLIQGPVDCEVFGAHFRLNPFDNVCEKRLLFTPQFFDPRERAMLIERARGAENEFVFVDVGANAGGYSLALAHAVGPKARILAIEPEPTLFERLCQNIRQNPGTAIKAVNCAVSDRDGEVALFVDRDNRAGSSIRMNGGDFLDGPTLVQGRMLEAVLREECPGRVHALKIDVDGFEDISLAPYLTAADDADLPDLLIINKSRALWHTNIRKILASRGYRESETTSQNIIFTRG